MNNILSYCGLVDARISASEKDLPVFAFICSMLRCIGILFLSIAITSATSFNNTCLLSDINLTPPTPNAPQTFLKDCPAWVIESTDAAWNTRQNVNASLEKYFYEHWSSTASWGQKVHGMDKLKNLVASTLRAFPDYRIHITDVFCYGNAIRNI